MEHRKTWLGVGAALALASQVGVATAQVPAAAPTVAESPCLQALKAEIANPTPKKKKNNVGKILGAVFGGALGAVVGSQICGRDGNGNRDIGCIAKYSLIGGTAGTLLGKSLDDKAKKKIAEASYTAAFSGQPSSLNFDNKCAFVEQSVPVQYEQRDIELAVAEGVTVPTALRSIGALQVAALPVKLQTAPKLAKKPVQTLPANQPNLVMGSVDGGKWLLIGQGSADTGFAATGYADAKGWTPKADLVPAAATIPGKVQNASVRAELPCSTVKLTVRVEGKGAQQESSDARYCKLPDGTTMQPDV